MDSLAPTASVRQTNGQALESGTYWSATTGGHVIYESRLELVRLLCADFDPLVHGIVAQPFLLKAIVEGRVRKHIPDYLLITKSGPVVVDVKPRQRWSEPVVSCTFAWTRQAVEARGWRYEVWDAPPAAALENIRFLAGYRRPWLFQPEVLEELRSADLSGMTLAQASSSLSQRPDPTVRAAVHHLLWSHDLHVDLTEPLRPSTVLRRTA
ncbi:TnsA-like heteromeric transposase endonuclease subunit [Streptomyces sp. NPDC052114]|uniref:TnsA-like heteromeric transposase endonuclease subunit n=1 Tax=unclassified Streptomyces TaxID=2593676 RepID=UPI0034419B55